MAEKRTIMRRGEPVAQTFVPTPHDLVERQLYEFSKHGGVEELVNKVNENNDLLKEILKQISGEK